MKAIAKIEDSPDEDTAAPFAQAMKQGSAATIMLVDDDDHFREALCHLIEQEDDFHCRWDFSTCEDALAAIEGHARPDIILMDIGLPGMSGIEGIRSIRNILPDVDIVVVTVFEENAKIFDAICAGASGYLLKQAAGKEIIKAVHDVIEGGAPINAQIARRILNMFTERVGPREDYGLTERELEILQKMVEGFTKKRIASELFLSYHTIDTHIKNIYAKLHVHTRSGAVAKAVRENLI